MTEQTDRIRQRIEEALAFSRLRLPLTFSPAPVCAAHTWQAWDWFGEPSPEIRPRCARCFLWAHDDAEQETKP